MGGDVPEPSGARKGLQAWAGLQMNLQRFEGLRLMGKRDAGRRKERRETGSIKNGYR